MCQALHKNARFVIDLTWSGAEKIAEFMRESRIPYERIDVSISPILTLLDKFLDLRQASDVALIFDDERRK